MSKVLISPGQEVPKERLLAVATQFRAKRSRIMQFSRDSRTVRSRLFARPALEGTMKGAVIVEADLGGDLGDE